MAITAPYPRRISFEYAQQFHGLLREREGDGVHKTGLLRIFMNEPQLFGNHLFFFFSMRDIKKLSASQTKDHQPSTDFLRISPTNESRELELDAN